MTTNKSKAAMRYAARLCCIYDWSVYQSMDRGAENLSREACLETLEALGSVTDPLADKLWSIVGDMFPGIGHADVVTCPKWFIPELVKTYEWQKREILAVQRLREVLYSEGITLGDLQEQTGEPYANFMRWTRFQHHIPNLIVRAVENLDASKRPWKTSDVFTERDRLRREYENAARIEKGKGIDGLST